VRASPVLLDRLPVCPYINVHSAIRTLPRNRILSNAATCGADRLQTGILCSRRTTPFAHVESIDKMSLSILCTTH